jgi:cystathionine beta-lyase
MEESMTEDITSFILCNPHNPVGRCYTHGELLEAAQFCEKHDLLLISDEIHCELVLEGQHMPAFTVSEWAKMHSVTLGSQGKIGNIPGLPMGFAIIPNPEIRARFDEELNGTMASYNVMTLAAYRKLYDGSCDQWKEDLRAFLDCSGLGLEDPADFFLKKAKVLLSSGEMYGDKTCVRLNYGCSPGQLEEALTRMGNALKKER